MMPMVFGIVCTMAETVGRCRAEWSRLKWLSADCLLAFRVTHRIAAMNKNPQIRPMIGERTMKSATVPTVFHRIAAKPVRPKFLHRPVPR